ncbi:MAG TPA: POTRA domain-containing protein [Pyrinomonadaceae bacterium]|nr:POTRA domain-containing protein [Pyrinomonadaceae bacterium]
MNQKLLGPILCVVFTAGISGLSGVVMAQTAAQTRVLPCEEDSPRPTLKRRQPLPDSSPGDENIPAQTPPERPKCEPSTDAPRIKDQDLVTVEFKGLYALDELNVRERLQKRGIVFSRTAMPDPETTNKAAGILKELLESQGYLEAKVDVLINEEARAVKFIIDQGPRLPIAAIKFAGNRIFASNDLSASMERCVVDIQDPSQSRYAPEEFEYCLQRVTNFMRSQGYLQAKLGEPENQITPEGLLITVPVKERALYRFGEIKIEGAKAIPLEQLSSRFALGRGDIANGEALGKWVYLDLKRLYGDLGYIQYTAELNPEFKAATDGSNEGVVDLSITIDEGRKFRLRSIKFFGNNLPEQEMRKLLLINDGDVYSQQLFADSINRLNETGWFEIIDGDKDSDFKTDEEEGLIDIVIKVATKGDPNYF